MNHLRRAPYGEAWRQQEQLQHELIRAKRNDNPVHPPHRILVVEHPPVFTLGKNGSAQNLLASPEQLERTGATFIETDRGGDITFHGPGQIVVYPILDLDRLETPEGKSLRDLHRYMRALEEAVIRTCADYDINARRIEKRTGVWVGPDARGPERKICAMGVRVSRWVTMHGLAFNVTTDLRWFDMIIPCGIADRGVTSLERELGAAPIHQQVETRLLDHLARQMGLSLRVQAKQSPTERQPDGDCFVTSENTPR